MFNLSCTSLLDLTGLHSKSNKSFPKQSFNCIYQFHSTRTEIIYSSPGNLTFRLYPWKWSILSCWTDRRQLYWSVFFIPNSDPESTLEVHPANELFEGSHWGFFSLLKFGVKGQCWVFRSNLFCIGQTTLSTVAATLPSAAELTLDPAGGNLLFDLPRWRRLFSTLLKLLTTAGLRGLSLG